MKKILFLVILFCFLPLDVFSLSLVDNSNLIYNVESVNFETNKITISGWSYVSENHSIGGGNYVTSLIAVRTSDVPNYLSGSKKFTNYDDFLIGSTSNAVGGYSNRGYKKSDGTIINDFLFGTTCHRVDNDVCDQGYYGLKNDLSRFNHSFQQGEISGSEEGTATCLGSVPTCLLYKPYFKVIFNIDDLKNKFKSDEITFLIKIDYFGLTGKVTNTSSGCKYLNGGYSCNKSRDKYMLKKIAVDESTVSGRENLSKKINSISSTINNKFKITTGSGRIQKVDEANNNISAKCCEGLRCTTFREGTYDILKSVIVNTKDDGGLPFTYKLRSYNLKLNNNSCIGGNNINDGWALSTWGIVDGEFKLRFTISGKKPNVKNGEIIIENNKCKDNSITLSNHQVLFSNDDIPTKDVNFPESDPSKTCIKPGKYRVEQIYEFTETNKLTMKTDFTNDGKGYNSGLGFGHSFDLNKTLTWKALPDLYYYVEYYYRDSDGNCITEPEKGYVDRSFFSTRGISLKSEDELKKEILENVKKQINNNQVFELKYNYPDSNDASKRAKNNNSNYIDVPDKLDINITLDSGTVNLTYNYNMLNAFIRKDDSFKEYSDSNDLGDDFILGDKNYFIAFNAYKYKDVEDNENDPLRFYTSINNIGIINKISDLDNTLTSKCYLKIVNGNLEKYKYRVIDLTNPFPNNEPSSTSNWVDLWQNKSSKRFLYDRRFDSKVESYKLDLNISKIRDYNKQKGKYLNTSVGLDGNSLYIFKDGVKTDHFNKIEINNILHKELGMRGVE